MASYACKCVVYASRLNQKFVSIMAIYTCECHHMCRMQAACTKISILVIAEKEGKKEAEEE